MDILGTIVGIFIWIIFKKIFKVRDRKEEELSEDEALAYIILAVMGRVVLYN